MTIDRIEGSANARGITLTQKISLNYVASDGRILGAVIVIDLDIAFDNAAHQNGNLSSREVGSVVVDRDVTADRNVEQWGVHIIDEGHIPADYCPGLD